MSGRGRGGTNFSKMRGGVRTLFVHVMLIFLILAIKEGAIARMDDTVIVKPNKNRQILKMKGCE